MLNSFEVLSKSFQQLNKQELYKILSLRVAVFCVEQNCPYQDIDGLDQSSQHLYVEDKGEIIAYARIIPPNGNICHIGRVVVAKEFRNHKLASNIMLTSIEYCQKYYPKANIEISAQSYLTGFYKKIGFISMKKYYLEDDIPHEQMQIKPI